MSVTVHYLLGVISVDLLQGSACVHGLPERGGEDCGGD